MIGQWVTAVLVVVFGIISMGLHVKADAKEEAKAIKDSYLKIVNGGMQAVGDKCENGSNEFAKDFMGWAGMNPDEVVKLAVTSLTEAGKKEDEAEKIALEAMKELRTKFEGYEENAKKMCSLKKALMCVDEKCVDCKADAKVENCDAATKIAEAVEAARKKRGNA